MAKPKNGSNNRVPRGYEREDTERRLKWLKEEKGIDFKDPPVNEPEELKGIIENHIGFMKLPMAITGPLLVDGQYAQGEFVVPISTLEGTLALSMSRGMYATFASGGIRVRHVKQELSRAPVFFFDNINDSFEFMDWVNKHKDKIIEIAESTTRFGKVLRIDQYPIQNYLILDFVLDTKNAAGQNMVTLAAKTACDYIKEETGYNYMVESNFNSDKKASTRNMILGRGHSIVAETVLKNSVLKRVLGITADLVQKLQRPGPTISAMAGTTGTHLHISNALTSIYLATGQDTACVSENSIGHFQTEPAENNGLACRLTLPSLTVGTVGGGTRLLPQKQNLEMLGCDGGEYSSRKLAEIIGASTLALEISLMSALASDTFTGSHMKYGRE
tara:strand:- start:369 stop:1532 length:1164 start_codon:yes stop_codon:yes gene_type:complete